jgi:xanthine permease
MAFPLLALRAMHDEPGDAAQNLIYNLDDRPPWPTALLVAVQHVLAMFVGIISVPLLVGQGLHLPVEQCAYLVSMGLIASGVGTFVQVLGIGPIGSRLLAVQGTSFAFLIPLQQAGKLGGLPLMFGMVLLCAPVEIILALFLFRLQRVFTPLVSGVVVLLIGLSLIPVGMGTIASGLGAAAPAWMSLLIAGLVVVVVLGMNIVRTDWTRLAAIPVALVGGYLLCLALGYLKTAEPATTALLNLPIPFRYGLAFNATLLLPFILVYVVTTLETVGDVTATSQLSRQPIEGDLYWRRLRGGVMADSVNSMFAAMCGSFPSTTFAQNNGVIQLTGVASRRVGLWIGGLLCLLGLLPSVSRWIALMPGPVLGAVTLLLFGFVASAGVRILQRVRLTHRNLLILASALGAGAGINAVPGVLDPLPETLRLVFSSGITTGTLAALLLNALLPAD